ncbi:carbonic anhydrase 14 [Pristis pectinata]|uniref:carbonic anhydrase 14 n=1 Tax=Pristis pectinata TaxID=685728 RepID=UPI00223CC68D|nr:carbonic anhydrase 14 [Pristis pectinata]
MLKQKHTNPNIMQRPRQMQRLLFLLLAQLLKVVFCDTNEGPEHERRHGGPTLGHWTYTDQDWKKDFQQCEGKSQSPINIETSKTMFNKNLPKIILEGYSLPETTSLNLTNNGHTVKLTLPDSMSISSGFSQKYLAAQLHFHWGSVSSSGSEHTVDGTRYAAEMHVVHYAAKYGSLSTAALEADGLAVLAVLFQVGPNDNKNYNHIFDKLQDVSEEGVIVQIPGFDVNTLLPRQLYRFFRYNGSLTTPPCFQTVTWTVFNDTIQLSKAQLHKLETNLKTGHHTLDSNFRFVQPLNGRKVFASFSATLASRRMVTKEDTAESGGDDKSGSELREPNAYSTHSGDTLAIIFGILFGCTVLVFVIYVLRQRKRRSLNTESGQKVIYKPTTTMEA